MAEPSLEVDGRSITLIGSFNPRIFQPAWFAHRGLLSELEVDPDDLNLNVMTQEVVDFETEWLHVQVLRGRFTASTANGAYFEQLFDLVRSTFEILDQTPLKFMGFNVDQHFRMRDEDQWHALGHALVPPDVWAKELTAPGMRAVVVKGDRDDGVLGSFNIKVEPSAQVHPGVFIEINDERRVVESVDEDVEGADAMLKFLTNSHWHAFELRAKRLVDLVLSVAP